MQPHCQQLPVLCLHHHWSEQDLCLEKSDLVLTSEQILVGGGCKEVDFYEVRPCVAMAVVVVMQCECLPHPCLDSRQNLYHAAPQNYGQETKAGS